MESLTEEFPMFSDQFWLADSDNREISAIRFSKDGRYMATGDRAGIVLIYKGPVKWWTLGNYRATSSILSFAWHPQKEGKLLIGCANGDVNTLFMAETDQMALNDYINFDGLINCVEYNSSGTQVAVVWGRTRVSLYEGLDDSYFVKHSDGCQQLQDASLVPVAQLLNLGSEYIVQSIHFVGDEKLIVCGYSPEMGIGVFSTSPPHVLLHRFQMRNEGHVMFVRGASALSPSETMLAVTNLSDDGVDFYSLETWSHYGAVAFDRDISKTHMKNCIQFMDKEHVVVGHQRGGGDLHKSYTNRGGSTGETGSGRERANRYEGCRKVTLAAATFSMKEDLMKTERGPRASVLRYLSNAEEESTSVKSDPSGQVHDDAEQGLHTRKSADVVLKNAEEESKSVEQDPPEQVYNDAAQGRQTRKSADVAVEDPHFRTEWKPCVALLLHMFATGVVIVVIYYRASRRPGTPLAPPVVARSIHHLLRPSRRLFGTSRHIGSASNAHHTGTLSIKPR
ncbi:hypothetical protein FPV67DRAFT_1449065 [Lyophyllum atratum]|nr:hypothetical protein FPV67DRAFT_1449065 [Lyophyllum atratum]